ncbi:hypothetical protein FRC19_001908 [Serendipita sp. 401]|nr:hypothetical protein FRC15_003845 [Serendipita sp. 397]KAG8824391.1 hypothetical protein FRC19_001908 [Serendipita sp. 401]KAG8837203.1 hypothetical protein FRC18_009829 [Serendipita sp. 400]KAG8875015.1 hypothetical protein FRC20_004732 [Serendipita sp. 405]KAG9056040.1 hypothetical protein FS842_000485 [Serendipita sp. 407]
MSGKGLKMRAVAYISPQNFPMLVKSFGTKESEELKYHYIAHTSLDVIEERINADPKATECFLGLLYVLEDVCVYGYITPTRVKIVLAMDQVDDFLKDSDVILLFKALHTAYHDTLCNPFLHQPLSQGLRTEDIAQMMGRGDKWKGLRRRLDRIAAAAEKHAIAAQ